MSWHIFFTAGGAFPCIQEDGSAGWLLYYINTQYERIDKQLQVPERTP